MSKKQKFIVVVEYLPNYAVKYSFINVPIKEDEGGGWYSVVGYDLICSAALYKFPSAYPAMAPSKLMAPYKELFKAERQRYESSRIHAQRMQSFTQLLINQRKPTSI